MTGSSQAHPIRYLSDYASGHDNNFTLLRFIAALLVLVTHSFALTGSPEPLRESLGVTWGSIAVDVFFVTSGFLVTGSLLYRKNLPEFLAARALRIFPALWVSLALTALVLGLFFTSLAPDAFFTDIQTWKFLVRNAILFKGIAWELPGTFADNPAKNAVNGSLWSLPEEIRMYLVLAGLWLSTSLFRIDRIRWVSIACVVLAIVAVGLGVTVYRNGAQSNLALLGAMFFSGAALRILSNRIRISQSLVAVIVIALVLAAWMDRDVFGVLYRLTLPYLVLFLALVPAGKIRNFNKLGDYSYGLYIYAFPVQQGIAQLWHNINPYEMMLMSFPVTLIFAIASWHMIEQRALLFKGKFR